MTTEWTIDTAMALLQSVMDERDLRYTQRFDAQEKAVVVALDTVNREFHEHLQQVRQETTLSLAAADKAIAKAEAAVEKRLEAMNEFRKQLSEQGITFLPRVEFDRAMRDLAKRIEDQTITGVDKLDAIAKTLDARISALQAQVSNVASVVT